MLYVVSKVSFTNTFHTTGQCHICGKTEVLETTWLLRSKVKTCYDNWMATHHGENSFTREDHAKGGRDYNSVYLLLNGFLELLISKSYTGEIFTKVFVKLYFTL